MLDCSGPYTCNRIWTKQGERPLSQSGDLLTVVCAQLHPRPYACSNHSSVTSSPKTTTGGSASAAHVKNATFAKDCENCAEVGRFRWRQRPRENMFVRPGVARITEIIFLIFFLAGAIVLVVRRRTCQTSSWKLVEHSVQTGGCTKESLALQGHTAQEVGILE